MNYTMSIPLQILRPLAADFDGDVLNILCIINKAFFEGCYEIFNPRNNMYISHNNGLANQQVCVQRDTIINANTLLWLGREYHDDPGRIEHIKSILKRNEDNELNRRVV